MIKLIEIEETASTNTLMSQYPDNYAHGSVLLARRQSSGRGQRGNSWEAEPYKNVTMSLMLRNLPVEAPQQFAVSEAVALAVADTLAALVPAHAGEIAVKWPNDIYVGNRKIAGILIECAVMGRDLAQVIAGIGLNVNQTEFLSDAPNPVSIAQLTGRSDYSIAVIATDIARRICLALTPGTFDAEALHAAYLSRLWRRTGEHLWRRRDSGSTFRASIAGISPEGFLSLLPSGAEEPLPPFAFKEVEAIL